MRLAKSVTLSTLKGICDGLGVTMPEFVDCKYFAEACASRREAVA